MNCIRAACLIALTAPLTFLGANEEFLEETLIEPATLQEAPLVPLSEETPFIAEEFEIPQIVETEQFPLQVELSEVAEEGASSGLVTQEINENNLLVVEEPTSVGELGRGPAESLQIDIKQAFRGSPIIYSLLLSLSICAVGIFLYSMGTISQAVKISKTLPQELYRQLMNNQFQEALQLCQEKKTLLPQMLRVAIQSRSHGLPTVVESMKLEAKRSTVFFWQKIGLLNDIAIVAPMLGLLGTVLGMFYAFYDVNRSIESVSTLFDGLGISVGTTVTGLVVAILALLLHSIAKYRLVRSLSKVENEAQALALLLDDKTQIQKG